MNNNKTNNSDVCDYINVTVRPMYDGIQPLIDNGCVHVMFVTEPFLMFREESGKRINQSQLYIPR